MHTPTAGNAEAMIVYDELGREIGADPVDDSWQDTIRAKAVKPHDVLALPAELKLHFAEDEVLILRDVSPKQLDELYSRGFHRKNFDAPLTVGDVRAAHQLYRSGKTCEQVLSSFTLLDKFALCLQYFESDCIACDRGVDGEKECSVRRVQFDEERFGGGR
jgi:hypothetical protein